MAKQIKAIVRGQEIPLTYNATTGFYEAQVTAPADSSFNEENGYFPVTVRAEDSAGNVSEIDSLDSAFGQFIRLYNKEEVKPIIEILSPTSGAYITVSRPTIKFKVTDNRVQTSGYSGINLARCSFKINGKDIMEFASNDDITTEEIEGGYLVTCTPSVDIPDSDNVTITVDCKDNDGNAADTATTVFTIDTVAPTLTVDTPADNLETNQDTIEVSGVTEPGVSVDVKLNGTTQGTVTADENGHFSKTVKFTQQGENTIEVIATDNAGLSTTITRTVVFNTTAPVFLEVKMLVNDNQITQSNPALAGKVYRIMVKMDE